MVAKSATHKTTQTKLRTINNFGLTKYETNYDARFVPYFAKYETNYDANGVPNATAHLAQSVQQICRCCANELASYFVLYFAKASIIIRFIACTSKLAT